MTSTNPSAPSSVSLQLGQGLLKKLLLGGGVAAAMALYGYELASKNPKETFALLQQFGPWFLVVVIGMVIASSLLRVMVAQMARLADGVQALAVGVTTIAAKDDRQQEEMQLIAQTNTQNSERLLVVMREHGRQLQTISDRLDRMGAK